MAVTQLVYNTSTGGIPSVGMKDLYTTGNIYFVDSNNGASTNSGLTSDQPLDTTANAISLVTANAGDFIILMPNHAETCAAETNLSKAGMTILGLGNGTNRPTITSTATASSWTFTADNITISNIVFQNNIDNQVEVIDIADAEYATVDNCEFLEGSAKQYLIGISITNAGADHVTITNCKLFAPSAGPSAGISIGVAASYIEIGNCWIEGDYSDACIQNPTGNVATNLNIHDCFLKNDQTGDHSIQLVSACTGALRRNHYANDLTQATACDTGACSSFECYHCDTVDVSGILSPVAT